VAAHDDRLTFDKQAQDGTTMLANLYNGTSTFAKFARVSAVVLGFSYGVTKLGMLKATTPSAPPPKKH
jgi:hypothetical protein